MAYCSVSLSNELENLHIKAGRIINNVPSKIIDHDILDIINWETLEYMYMYIYMYVYNIYIYIYIGSLQVDFHVEQCSIC